MVICKVRLLLCGKRRIGEKIYYACDMYDAVLDADVLMLVTEWKEFRLPSWAVIKKTMAQQIVLDGGICGM